MYRVLYRKYRPRFFADVIGQPQVTDTLKNEVKSDRLSHAYLFTGSRGTGKTTCSKILAKAVNCLSPHDGDPCGECAICRGIDDGSVMDVAEIDAASNNGVDDIRMLREEAAFSPANARYRVYIIDEVHMLSVGAFNALLKTLEEPPPHVMFILATTEVHKLPATILSRCQRFDFHRIAPAAIADRLEFVCRSENCEIDRNAAVLIAGISDGAMRDALSLLDQCMSKNQRITEELVRQTAGLSDKSHIFSLTEDIIQQNTAEALRTINTLYQASKDMTRLCEELTEHFRSLMLMKTVDQVKEILVMPEDEFEQTRAQAKKLSLAQIIDLIDILQSAKEKMLKGVNRRIQMEMTMVQLSSERTADNSELANRVAALEKKLEEIKTLPTSPLVKEEKQATLSFAPSVPQNIKKPSREKMEELRNHAVLLKEWADIIEDAKKNSPTLGASLEGSTAYISGQYVLIDSKNTVCFQFLKNKFHKDIMKASIKAFTGREYNLGPYSYPDESIGNNPDSLNHLIQDLKSAGISVDEKK